MYLPIKSLFVSILYSISTITMYVVSVCFQYFQKEMPAKFESDPEMVMSLAFSLKINAKKMKKMEKEYMTMKTKEKEDEIELRVRAFTLPLKMN